MRGLHSRRVVIHRERILTGQLSDEVLRVLQTDVDRTDAGREVHRDRGGGVADFIPSVIRVRGSFLRQLLGGAFSHIRVDLIIRVLEQFLLFFCGQVVAVQLLLESLLRRLGRGGGRKAIRLNAGAGRRARRLLCLPVADGNVDEVAVSYTGYIGDRLSVAVGGFDAGIILILSERVQPDLLISEICVRLPQVGKGLFSSGLAERSTPRRDLILSGLFDVVLQIGFGLFQVGFGVRGYLFLFFLGAVVIAAAVLIPL